MPKISSKFDQNRSEIREKKLNVLDEELKTQRRKVDCKIKTNF